MLTPSTTEDINKINIFLEAEALRSIDMRPINELFLKRAEKNFYRQCRYELLKSTCTFRFARTHQMKFCQHMLAKLSTSNLFNADYCPVMSVPKVSSTRSLWYTK